MILSEIKSKILYLQHNNDMAYKNSIFIYSLYFF